MYIRKAQRTYKGKTYTNHLLVESVSTPQGPRQKVICSLGDLSPRPRAEWLALARKLEAALVGQQQLPLRPPAAEWTPLVVRAQRALQCRRSATSENPPAGLNQIAASDDDLIAVHADRIRTERHRQAGAVHVGYQFWLRLGMDPILEQA